MSLSYYNVRILNEEVNIENKTFTEFCLLLPLKTNKKDNEDTNSKTSYTIITSNWKVLHVQKALTVPIIVDRNCEYQKHFLY